jgi:hypothetical protein
VTKGQAFANLVRAAAAASLLAFAVSGPAAYAQFAQGDRVAPPRAAVDRDFLIGTWSDAGDCTTTVAFTADGGYATADGLQGQWSLAGETLTLQGEAGSATLTIIPIDRNTMEVIGEDGSHERSTRCAGRLGGAEFDDLRVA